MKNKEHQLQEIISIQNETINKLEKISSKGIQKDSINEKTRMKFLANKALIQDMFKKIEKEIDEEPIDLNLATALKCPEKTPLGLQKFLEENNKKYVTSRINKFLVYYPDVEGKKELLKQGYFDNRNTNKRIKEKHNSLYKQIIPLTKSKKYKALKNKTQRYHFLNEKIQFGETYQLRDAILSDTKLTHIVNYEKSGLL